MTISIDSSALLSFYQTKTGQTGSTGSPGTSRTAAKIAPTPPWDVGSGAPRSTQLVTSVMAGRKFIDVGSAQLDLKGTSQDYRKLFALFQGLNALNGLAERAGTKGVSSLEVSRLQATFTKGLTETAAFLDSLKLDNLRLARGESLTKDSTLVGVKRTDPTYLTGPVHTGGVNDEVAAFQGDVQFNASIKRGAVTTNLAFDLSEMGSTPRSMGNVVNYLNGKLQAAGLTTRFAVERTPAQPRTVEVGGKTVTLAPGADSYALKIKGDETEALTLSAPATAGAVYLTQGVGAADAQARQLLKFQTDTSLTVTAPPAAFAPNGESFTVAGRVFAKPLGAEVAGVRSTATGSDGSVYLLADVTGPSDGQAVKGSQDVALLKYDSAGNLIYSRTLGAASQASGMALAVSADGKVAVAGSVTGLMSGTDLANGATTSDSFVTVFNAAGEEEWTQRRAARDEDEATAVAFGADGSVFVAGRAKSAMPGAAAIGGWDSYVEGFTSAGVTRFTTQVGTTGDDKPGGLVVDGSSVVLASVEGGHAILRRFDVPVSGAATLAATRDLGSLGGGTIAGLALDGGNLVIAGSSGDGALSAGSVTAAYTSGQDAFAAKISANLTANAADRIAYYGGAGDSAATALTVSGGQVWIAGTADGDLPSSTAIGEQDGFLARLDLDTGAATWARRFSGKDGEAAPTSISVDPTGASVLDRLGLPSGTIDYTDSTLLTAASSVRAGDQFYVKTSEGGSPAAVTIEANDTLATLATKISRASGFRVVAKVVKDGLYDRLEITSQNDRSTVELVAGKGGKDALEALGLSEGVVRTLKTGETDKGLEKFYGLKLDLNLDLGSPKAIKYATDELMAAMAVIRTAYRDLKAASDPAAAARTPTGPVPAYLKNQIANYQEALRRLGG